MVLAAVAQLFAGLAASTLAALDDYVTAALGYIAASAVGLAYIIARIDADGIDAVAVGMALNGARRCRPPDRGARAARPADVDAASAMRPSGLAARRSGWCVAAQSVALPLALQAVYLVCLPFAAPGGRRRGDELRVRVPRGVGDRRGDLVVARSRHVGAATRRSASIRPASRATSSRRPGSRSSRSARPPGSSRWRETSLVGGMLGAGFSADVGDELGRLVALLSPWMVFVDRRSR